MEEFKPHTGIEIGSVCWRCGKPIVQYYNILCMDCADELGISEIFLHGKSEEEAMEIVEKKIREDIEKAVKWIDEGEDKRLHVLWQPLFSKFPNITLKTLISIMFSKKVKA